MTFDPAQSSILFLDANVLISAAWKEGSEIAPRRDAPAAKDVASSEDASTTKLPTAEVPSAAAESAPSPAAAAALASSPAAEMPGIPESQHVGSSEAVDAPVVAAQ